MFSSLDPEIKIVLLCLFLSACITTFLLGFVLLCIWLIDWRKARRMVRRMRSEMKANEEAKAIFRRKKEREARQNMKDDEFSRKMWEMLSEH